MLTPYDQRTLRDARAKLTKALYQVNLALQEERGDPDRRFRCMFAASYTVQATTLLDHATRRMLKRATS